MNITPKYFESHVTIEPVFGERLAVFEERCKQHQFKAAKLLMQKDREETPQRSSKDTFCTGHALSFVTLQNRMMDLVGDLEERGFKVWRYKIEAVLTDVRLPR